MRVSHQRQRGQVVVMVTLILFAMCGILGLAVDLGWSYFVKKSAMSAGDAAALASVEEVFDTMGEGPYVCGVGATCLDTPTPCGSPVPKPPANNIDNGCLYAQKNGFTAQGNDNRQNVTMQAGVGAPPTAPGVAGDYYWVTTRVAETIPQLFSSIFGNWLGTSSHRSTAGVVDSVVPGSLILLNRDPDCLPMGEGVNTIVCGVNLLSQANDNQGLDAVRADGGIQIGRAHV